VGRFLIISGVWLTWPNCKIYIWKPLRFQYFWNCFLDINSKESHSFFWRSARFLHIYLHHLLFYSTINLSWGTSIRITSLIKYLITSLIKYLCTYRRLQGNSFQGPIPTSLSNLVNLKKLWVPSSFCDCRIIIVAKIITMALIISM